MSVGGVALAIALVSQWVVRLWHVPNARGKSKHKLLKNAKGRLYYFLGCPKFYILTMLTPVLMILTPLLGDVEKQ